MNEERKQKEFFKMFNNMNECGQVSIISNGAGLYCACTMGNTEILEDYGFEAVRIHMDVQTSLSEWCESPYEAIKFCYMTEFLGIEETTDVTFDLDEDLEEKLYQLADEEGIPVDELVNDILIKAIF
jgi:hypothetical protein